MKEVIQINGQSYPIKFGYGAIKILGELWGLPGYMEVVDKILAIMPEEGQDFKLDFETLNILGDVVCAGIANAGGDIDRDDVIDAFMEDLDIVSTAFTLFMQKMPKGKENSKKKTTKTPIRKK